MQKKEFDKIKLIYDTNLEKCIEKNILNLISIYWTTYS